MRAEIGLLDEVGERDRAIADQHLIVEKLDAVGRHLVGLGREVDEAALDRGGCRARGHAVEVRARRRRGRRGVRHLRGRGRRDPDLVEVDAELLGDDLGDLDEQPLPHLGAAVIEVDRAVLIDVHQRARLVEEGRGEGDAELDRRQRDAALEVAALGIERRDRLAPRAVVRRCLQRLDQLGRDVVGHLHAVRRHVAAGAVEIGLAHVERIEPERPRDVVEHPLDRDHALRSAEAAKGGVRDRVGLHAPGDDAGGRQIIGVVGMEHGAIVDRAGKIGGIAAARGQRDIERGEPALVIEAHLVVGAEIVPLAGETHVVVAVEAESCTAAR